MRKSSEPFRTSLLEKDSRSVFALPEAHRKRTRTSNAFGILNDQLKKRTRVVGFFPSEESLLRLVTGVLIGIWETSKAYLKPAWPKSEN